MNKSKVRELTGWWLTGAIGVTVVAAGIADLIWNEIRSNTEKMEGGWTRTVYDNTNYLPVFAWTCAIGIGVWSLGFLACWLVEGTK